MACKNNIILTSTCIISSVTCVALTFWGQIKNNGTITTDSYIGIIASLIGVCATIVVGFQISSFFELRNLKQQIDQVEKQRKDFELYKTLFKGRVDITQYNIKYKNNNGYLMDGVVLTDDVVESAAAAATACSTG